MANDKLTKYKAKRDFKQTQEPSGQSSVKPSDRRRFVIQKHDATRLHYDLRLELDGVFKSWAVTRGPSLDPKDKRLAVEVEDHPLDYGDFEGTIPKGQYGGGTVMLWDRGYWEPEGKKSPEQALAKGDLKFMLNGKRLQGSFVLVRMAKDRERGKRTNWLLIKHRDDFAVEANGAAILEGFDISVASGRSRTIEAGKGSKPKPFMHQGENVDADASGTVVPALPPKSARQNHLARKSDESLSLRISPTLSSRNSARLSTGHPQPPDGSTRSSSTATASRCVWLTAGDVEDPQGS